MSIRGPHGVQARLGPGAGRYVRYAMVGTYKRYVPLARPV